ncbi:MAG: RNA polymerase sigma factor [Bacillota bacterium]
MQSDAQLVQAVLSGDRAAYGALVQRYQRAVYAAALAVLHDRDAAQDAAQDAFVIAFEKLGSLRDPGAFGGWLLMITGRHAMRRSRSPLRWVPIDAADELPADSSDAHGQLDEAAQQMLDALGRLPDHEQRVLMLRYFDDHPVAAIAQMTGRAIGTVTKQISRALQRLRDRLKEKNP